LDPYQIIPANWRDLGAVRQLEHICFPKDAWPLWDLLGSLTFPSTIRLKAVLNRDGHEMLIGFIVGDIRQHEGVSWIATVGVLPEYRGRGVGEALIRACEQRMPTRMVRLNVRVSNAIAIRLYQRLGYHQLSTWAAYYDDREDALVMEKVLRPE
jgi:ribosomal-protein-alanine N-acetyltransferase